MRIAGIVIASVGALGLLSLCINGDVYNGLVGGGIMIIVGIIMILRGKSKVEIAAIKEEKRQRLIQQQMARKAEKATSEEAQTQIQIDRQPQADVAVEKNRIEQENFQVGETTSESADFYNYNLYDSTYRQIMDKYYKNIERIQTNASILYNLGVTDGEKMDELIQLCYQNIDEFKQACTQWKRYGESCPPSAPAFERLAIIYERQKRYEDAIKICVQAIKAGLAEDNYTKRIARLLKKSGTEDLGKYQDLLLR